MRMSWQYLPSPNCVLRTLWYYQTSLGVSEKLIQLKRNVDHDDQSFCRHVEDFETHEVTNSPSRTSFRLFLLFVDICQSYCNNLLYTLENLTFLLYFHHSIITNFWKMMLFFNSTKGILISMKSPEFIPPP